MVQSKRDCKSIQSMHRGWYQRQPVSWVGWFLVRYSFPSQLPQNGAFYIMAKSVHAVATPKQALADPVLMHTMRSGPSPTNRFPPNHSGMNLDKLENIDNIRNPCKDGRTKTDTTIDGIYLKLCFVTFSIVSCSCFLVLPVWVLLSVAALPAARTACQANHSASHCFGKKKMHAKIVPKN